MTLIRRHIIGLLAIAATVTAVPAYAAPHKAAPHKAVPHAVRANAPIYVQSAPRGGSFVKYAQKSISPSQAKSIAAKRMRGAKFVDISRSGDRYRVRMLRKDGRVVDVLIDAATGRVLN